MDEFLAGAGRQVITPAVGARLYGYTPDVVSESVNDDLTASAFAFARGDVKALLISVTVCLVNTALSDEIRAAVAAATGVPAAHIILCATHTHSGPCTEGNTGWGELDRAYCDSIFIPGIIAAAQAAVENLCPAVMGVGTVHSRVGVNRRQHNRDNTVSLGQNPWGCQDPVMTVLSFRSKNGRPLAAMVHYGAHCTASGKNTEITRDWAGVMIDRLEAESGAMTAFFNGAEGDVGPRLTNGHTVGGLRYAMEHGAVAAADALEAFRSIKEYRVPSFACATGEVRLPYAQRMPLKEAESALSALEGASKINLSGRLLEYLAGVAEAWRSGSPVREYFTFPQTLIKIGPAVLIPFPFEFFSEIALRLRQYSTFAHTLCLGCTNGNFGYLPTRGELCRGGYEIEMFRTSGDQTLTDDADDCIIAENLRIAEALECTE